MFINEFKVVQEKPFDNDKLNRKDEIKKITFFFCIGGKYEYR